MNNNYIKLVSALIIMHSSCMAYIPTHYQTLYGNPPHQIRPNKNDAKKLMNDIYTSIINKDNVEYLKKLCALLATQDPQINSDIIYELSSNNNYFL